METEKLRAKQSTIKAVAAGSVAGGATGLTGLMAGPVAMVTVPLGAGIGAGIGWGIGSLFTGATTAAVEREHSRYLERHQKPKKEEKEEKEKEGKRRSQSAQGWEGDLLGANEEKEGMRTNGKSVKGQQLSGDRVIVSFRCWENQRYANRVWDHGNLNTGERDRWWVEKEKEKGEEEEMGGNGGSPAVIHPEPMLEPEYPVTWVHDWVAEDALDPTGKVFSMFSFFLF